MNRSSSFLIALIGSLLAANVWACGDSLYRVGKGAIYRVYTAPLPGNVLVYGHTAGAEQLAKALAESGHHVAMVKSEADLSQEMDKGSFDVVIAAYSDHDAVESAVRDSASQPAYVPVASSESEAEIAQQSHASVMLADRDEIKNFLRAIHYTLKSRH